MSAEVVQLAGIAAPAVREGPEVPRVELEDAPPMMSPETLSRVLDDIRVATLAEWRTKDRGKPVDQMVGPPWRKLGGAVRYLKGDVEAWIARLQVSPRS